MKIEKWNESEFGEMNFESICRLYSSDKNIRFEKKPPFIRAFTAFDGDKIFEIRWNKYQSGSNFGGEAIAADYFILNGKCEITIGENKYELQKGERFEFPKCRYDFKVTSKEDFEYVAAYKLPKNLLAFK